VAKNTKSAPAKKAPTKKVEVKKTEVKKAVKPVAVKTVSKVAPKKATEKTVAKVPAQKQVTKKTPLLTKVTQMISKVTGSSTKKTLAPQKAKPPVVEKVEKVEAKLKAVKPTPAAKAAKPAKKEKVVEPAPAPVPVKQNLKFREPHEIFAADAAAAIEAQEEAADEGKKDKKVKGLNFKITPGEEKEKWAELQNKMKSFKAKNYSMRDVFEAQTPIQHKVLGWGVILNVQNDRLEVLFKDGIKFLISNYQNS